MSKFLLRLLALAGFGAVEQVMRHHSFSIYLIGHIPSVIGVWVTRVAIGWLACCLLYTSDAADEGLGVDLGGRRII